MIERYIWPEGFRFHRFRWYGRFCLDCGTSAREANTWPMFPCNPPGQPYSNLVARPR